MEACITVSTVPETANWQIGWMQRVKSYLHENHYKGVGKSYWSCPSKPKGWSCWISKDFIYI